MRISFDIDDTLVCLGAGTEFEPVRVPWVLRWWLNERIRLGTVELMKQLIADGWEIALYTTSFRSPFYLRSLLRCYGVRIRLAVNQTLHEQVVGKEPSKLPSRFGIDLHVDDSKGVELEGDMHGFRVVVVSPEDRDWSARVLAAARQVMAQIQCAQEKTRHDQSEGDLHRALHLIVESEI